MKTLVSLSALAHLVAVTTLTGASSAQWTGEWPMDMTGGPTTFDVSGAGNHGTLNNFTGNPWVPGMFVNALSFDGVDDYVSPTSQSSIYDGLGSPYSVAYWVKAPAQLNAFVYAEGTLPGTAILIFGSGQYTNAWDKFRVYCRNDQGNVPFTGISNAVVYDNTWHHVAFVDVAGQITLYIDGVIDTANIAYDPARLPGRPGHGTFSMNTASFGALRRGSVCCHMVGLVDDLRLYKFAMSQTDVTLAMAGVPVLPTSASIGEYGVGCGVGPFDLVGSGSAVIGGPGIQLQMQAGPPNALAMQLCGFGPVAPVDLGQYGFNGCTAYPANFVAFVTGFLDLNGNAPATVFAIPNDPGLAFVQLNCQAAALSTTAIEFSDVVEAMLGN